MAVVTGLLGPPALHEYTKLETGDPNYRCTVQEHGKRGGGLIFQECNDHLLALFLIKPRIPLVSIIVDVISNKGNVTWGATRNNFEN